MSRIIDCNALCLVGMVITLGRIFVENALEAIVENACAVTDVCTWLEAGGMSSYRLPPWVNCVWGERWEVRMDRRLPPTSNVYAGLRGWGVCARDDGICTLPAGNGQNVGLVQCMMRCRGLGGVRYVHSGAFVWFARVAVLGGIVSFMFLLYRR
jgi:hypothetical protein